MTRRLLVLGLPAVLGVTACGAPGPRVADVVPPAVAGQSADPALAVEPATGDLLLAWVAGDSAGWHLYFARSRDHGATWSDPARVTDREHDVHPHGESSPRLVVAPGVIAVAWTNSVSVPGRRWPASNIRFSRSTDGGVTWTPAITLNDDTASGVPGGHIFHGAAWHGDSGIVVAWLDERGGAPSENTAGESHAGHHRDPADEADATVYAARSDDRGRTWEPNHALWPAACPCCRVSLARAPGGGVAAAWRQHFPGDVRDVVTAPMDWVVPSRAAERVHVDGWVYPGCPHTGPAIAVDGRGATHVVWFTGRPGAAGVRYARRDRGAAFSDPLALVAARTLPTAHPAVAAWRDGRALVASDVGSDGARVVRLALITSEGEVAWQHEVRGSAGADHPAVVVPDDSTAFVAWTALEGDRRAVRLVRVRIG